MGFFFFKGGGLVICWVTPWTNSLKRLIQSGWFQKDPLRGGERTPGWFLRCGRAPAAGGLGLGPTVCERVTSSPPSRQPERGGHQYLHVRAWTVPGMAAQPLAGTEPGTQWSGKSPVPATPGTRGQGSPASSSTLPYCRLRQQMAMAAATLLPGTLAATQVSSTA